MLCWGERSGGERNRRGGRGTLGCSKNRITRDLIRISERGGGESVVIGCFLQASCMLHDLKCILLPLREGD